MRGNLGELVLAAAAAFGDDVAFQVRRGFRLERTSFREAGLRARGVAAWLGSKGLQPGDRVAVWAPNMPEYAVLYFGAWTAGIVVVPIDVRTKQDTVDGFVAAARPRLGFKSRYLEGTFGHPVEETIILEDLFELIHQTPVTDALPNVGPDSLCEIAFTSGTTGIPKGVTLTHGNLLAEVEALQTAFPLQRSYRGLSLLPLSHIFEQVVNLLLAFSSGVRMSYVPRVNAATIARTLREDRISCFIVVPQLLRLMLDGMQRRAREQGREGLWAGAHRIAPWLPFSLRRVLFHEVQQALGGQLIFIGCGSAPLDVDLASAWERMGIRIFEGYGLTEVSGATTINSWAAARLGTVGKPLPGVEIRTAADGEILIRGATVSPGYLEAPDLNARSFEDGWFHSGDGGFVDSDGFLHISGRSAFKIVLADGRNVYPEDVERALNMHPLVRESCVVGFQRGGGETVHAVLLTHAVDRASEIIRATNRLLSPHQQIMSHSVWSDEDFPRTPILKVDRRLVLEAVERDQTAAPPSSEPGAAAPGDPLWSLVARAADRPASDFSDDAELGTDLGLDSIGRIELLSAIETELGRVVDELHVGPQTTLAQLRVLVAEGAVRAPERAPARWPRGRWARAIGAVLLWIAFRLQDRWMRIEVVHRDRARSLPFPSILIFNYQGPYVALAMLRAVPSGLRGRVAVAVDSRLWKGPDRWQGLLANLAIQAFPFVKSGAGVRASLEELARWLDDGYAVIISPEGNPEVDGELLPFLGGTGLMAVEMGVPVVPFKFENYHKLFPREGQFPYLPNRRGRVRLTIGQPVTFPPATPYAEATERLRQGLVETG